MLSYVDAHLNETPDLEQLATFANLSKFHFHRIIRAYLNETLGNYINRIRLETAVKLLRYSSQPIYEIGYQVGYQTPSAFAKAVKKMFGVSPSQIRKNKNLIIAMSTKNIKHDFQLVQSFKTIQDIHVIFSTIKRQNW